MWKNLVKPLWKRNLLTHTFQSAKRLAKLTYDFPHTCYNRNRKKKARQQWRAFVFSEEIMLPQADVILSEAKRSRRTRTNEIRALQALRSKAAFPRGEKCWILLTPFLRGI
jgi:hypothetical protein